MDPTDLYTTFHTIAAEYTFFWSAHRTFSSIDHMIGYKTFNKFKKIEITANMLSDQTDEK